MRDACTLCETVFDGDTPRTTPGCELCGTCEACGCQVDLDTARVEIITLRAVMRQSRNTETYFAASAQVRVLERHQREVS